MMTIDEAQAELMILRGLAEGGNDLALVRDRIERLYRVVCRKSLRRCKCKDVLPDALLEIYQRLRYYNDNNMEQFETKARLVNGVVLQWQGNHYTNANLTDEVATAFLAQYPEREDWFAVLPTAEVAENAPTEAKVADEPTTPKKKKTAKKGK